MRHSSLVASSLLGALALLQCGNSQLLDNSQYHDFDELDAFLDSLAAADPSLASVVDIGTTYEGRQMRVARIGSPTATKNAILFAGIHANEWIGPAVLAAIADELVSNNAAHPEYTDNIAFHILPSANPDGYQYTFDADRQWRKSRRINDNSPLGCIGVDLNRNWDVEWGMYGNTSPDPCSELYHGAEVFSEQETQNIRDYFLSLDPVPELAATLHAANEVILVPYTWALNVYPANIDEVVALAEDAVAALNAVNGEEFKVVNTTEFYVDSGTSNDWFGYEGSRFSYNFELKNDGYGQELPPELIQPAFEETWAAFEVILAKMLE